MGFRAWRPLAGSLQPRSLSPAFWSPGGAVPLSGGAGAQISVSEVGEGTQETRGCARPTPLRPPPRRLCPSTPRQHRQHRWCSPATAFSLRSSSPCLSYLVGRSLLSTQAWWGGREGSASARPPTPPAPGRKQVSARLLAPKVQVRWLLRRPGLGTRNQAPRPTSLVVGPKASNKRSFVSALFPVRVQWAASHMGEHRNRSKRFSCFKAASPRRDPWNVSLAVALEQGKVLLLLFKFLFKFQLADTQCDLSACAR